jgi:hypothetical protein
MTVALDAGEITIVAHTTRADDGNPVHAAHLAKALRSFPMAEVVPEIRRKIARNRQWLADYRQRRPGVPPNVVAQVARNAEGLHYDQLHRGPRGYPDSFYRRLTARRLELQGVRNVNRQLVEIATKEEWTGGKVTVENVRTWLKEAKRRGIAAGSGKRGDPSFKAGPKFDPKPQAIEEMGIASAGHASRAATEPLDPGDPLSRYKPSPRAAETVVIIASEDDPPPQNWADPEADV